MTTYDHRFAPSGGAAGDINVGTTERWLSAIGGGLLAVYGLERGGGSGILLALLGGSLAYRGATGHCPMYSALGVTTVEPQEVALGPVRLPVPKPAAVHLETAITIQRPADELYRFWRQQENLPRFMLYIDSVTSISDTRSHWVTKGAADARLEWDSEITADVPGERIAWRSLEGSDIDHQGEVRFQPAPGGRGTEVRLKVDMVPGGGMLGKAAQFLKGLPEQMLHEDLRRFKRLQETGEIPTIQGQPSARVASKT